MPCLFRSIGVHVRGASVCEPPGDRVREVPGAPPGAATTGRPGCRPGATACAVTATRPAGGDQAEGPGVRLPRGGRHATWYPDRATAVLAGPSRLATDRIPRGGTWLTTWMRTRVRRTVAPPCQERCRSGSARIHPLRGARRRLPSPRCALVRVGTCAINGPIHHDL